MSGMQGGALCSHVVLRPLEAGTPPLPPPSIQPHRRPQPLRPLLTQPVHVTTTTPSPAAAPSHEPVMQPLRITHCHDLLVPGDPNTCAATRKQGCSSCTSTTSSQSSQGVSTQPVTPSSTSSTAKPSICNAQTSTTKGQDRTEANTTTTITTAVQLALGTMMRQIKRPTMPARVAEADKAHIPPVRRVFTRHTLASPTLTLAESPHYTSPGAKQVSAMGGKDVSPDKPPHRTPSDAQRLRVFELLRATYAELDRDVMHPITTTSTTRPLSASGSGALGDETAALSAEELEQRRVMWLQQHHHNMEVIRNGGHETVRPGMRSSATLANSLMRLRARHGLERTRSTHSININSSIMSNGAGGGGGDTCSVMLSSVQDSVLSEDEHTVSRQGRLHEAAEEQTVNKEGSDALSIVLSPREDEAHEMHSTAAVRQAWGHVYDNTDNGPIEQTAVLSPRLSFLQEAGGSAQMNESRPCTGCMESTNLNRRCKGSAHKGEAVLVMPFAHEEDEEDNESDSSSNSNTGVAKTRFGQHKPHYDQDVNSSTMKIKYSSSNIGSSCKITCDADDDEDEVLFSFTSCRKPSVPQRSEPSCSVVSATGQEVLTVEELENSPEVNPQGSRLYTVKKLFGMIETSMPESTKTKKRNNECEASVEAGHVSSSSSEDGEPMLSMDSFRRSSIHRIKEERS